MQKTKDDTVAPGIERRRLSEATGAPVERRRAPRPSPALARRIRDVLVQLGGEAHRSEVIATLARDEGLDSKRVPEELEARAIVSFEKAWRNEAQRQALGFHLKFGEGSHRWAVKELSH